MPELYFNGIHKQPVSLLGSSFTAAILRTDTLVDLIPTVTSVKLCRSLTQSRLHPMNIRRTRRSQHRSGLLDMKSDDALSYVRRAQNAADCILEIYYFKALPPGFVFIFVVFYRTDITHSRTDISGKGGSAMRQTSVERV